MRLILLLLLSLLLIKLGWADGEVGFDYSCLDWAPGMGPLCYGGSCNAETGYCDCLDGYAGLFCQIRPEYSYNGQFYGVLQDDWVQINITWMMRSIIRPNLYMYDRHSEIPPPLPSGTPCQGDTEYPFFNITLLFSDYWNRYSNSSRIYITPTPPKASDLLTDYLPETYFLNIQLIDNTLVAGDYLYLMSGFVFDIIYSNYIYVCQDATSPPYDALIPIRLLEEPLTCYEGSGGCGTHGTCIWSNECECESENYTGDQCDVWTCAGPGTDGCNDHGTCSDYNYCDCDEGFLGGSGHYCTECTDPEITTEDCSANTTASVTPATAGYIVGLAVGLTAVAVVVAGGVMAIGGLTSGLGVSVSTGAGTGFVPLPK